MSNAVRYSAHDDSVGPIQPAILAGNEEKPATDVVVRDSNEGNGAVVFRNGEATFEQRGLARATPTTPASDDPLDNAIDGIWKSPIPRSALKGDSLIKIGGVEGDLAGFERLGLVEKGPDGQYRIAEAKPEQETQSEQQTEPMAKLSDKAENAITAVSNNLGDSAMFGLMDAVMEGKEHALATMLPDYASRLGLEPDQMQRMVSGVTKEFSEQARTALQMDPETFQAFADDAWSKNPGAIREAITAQVQHGNLGPLKQLGAKFTAGGAAYSDDDLLSADLGENVRVYRDSTSGKLMLSAKGQTMLAREAIKHGVVRVSRSR